MALNGRCDCGFVKGLCPTHDRATRNEGRVTREEIYVVGAHLAGVTVVERLPDQHVIVRCACGETFEITTPALSKARKAKTTRSCPKCRTERKPSL